MKLKPQRSSNDCLVAALSMALDRDLFDHEDMAPWYDALNHPHRIANGGYIIEGNQHQAKGHPMWNIMAETLGNLGIDEPPTMYSRHAWGLHAGELGGKGVLIYQRRRGAHAVAYLDGEIYDPAWYSPMPLEEWPDRNLILYWEKIPIA